MEKTLLTATILLGIFLQISGDVNVEAINKKIAQLRDVQEKIMRREAARIDKESPKFKANLNNLIAQQKYQLTHTWNMFSSLTAYIESALELILAELVTADREAKYFEDITSFLDDVVLKAIESDTEQCETAGEMQNICATQRHWPRDCSDVQPKVSGLTRISHRLNSYLFYCEQDLFEGGWTLFWQSDLSFFGKYRDDADVSNQESHKFVHGFGKPCYGQTYTLGLEMVHQLTYSRKYQLIVYYEDTDGRVTYSHFEEFTTGGASNGYNALALGGHKGNATNSYRNMKIKTEGDKGNFLLGLRSLLPQGSWGTVKMLIRPSEIPFNWT